MSGSINGKRCQAKRIGLDERLFRPSKDFLYKKMRGMKNN